MSHVLLVKHSAPQVVLGISPENWVLSAEGQKRCEPLAAHMRGYRPKLIFHSEEAKATETAALLGKALGVASHVGYGLHEHDRGNVPHLR